MRELVSEAPQPKPAPESATSDGRIDWFEDTEGLDIHDWTAMGSVKKATADAEPSLDATQTWGGAPTWEDEPEPAPAPTPPVAGPSQGVMTLPLRDCN